MNYLRGVIDCIKHGRGGTAGEGAELPPDTQGITYISVGDKLYHLKQSTADYYTIATSRYDGETTHLHFGGVTLTAPNTWEDNLELVVPIDAIERGAVTIYHQIVKHPIGEK